MQPIDLDSIKTNIYPKHADLVVHEQILFKCQIHFLAFTLPLPHGVIMHAQSISTSLQTLTE